MIAHKLTCVGARVSIQTGLTRDLHTCRSCSAHVYVPRTP